MAEKKHSSQTIMVISIVAGVLLTLIAWPLSMLGKSDTGVADEAESRILPVARVEIKRAEEASDGKPKSPEAVYNGICKACHGTGAAGSPMVGDKAAWAPRIATGSATLFKVAKEGKGGMPPRGGTSLSDDELKAVIDYMVSKSK